MRERGRTPGGGASLKKGKSVPTAGGRRTEKNAYREEVFRLNRKIRKVGAELLAFCMAFSAAFPAAWAESAEAFAAEEQNAAAAACPENRESAPVVWIVEVKGEPGEVQAGERLEPETQEKQKAASAEQTAAAATGPEETQAVPKEAAGQGAAQDEQKEIGEQDASREEKESSLQAPAGAAGEDCGQENLNTAPTEQGKEFREEDYGQQPEGWESEDQRIETEREENPAQAKEELIPEAVPAPGATSSGETEENKEQESVKTEPEVRTDALETSGISVSGDAEEEKEQESVKAEPEVWTDALKAPGTSVSEETEETRKQEFPEADSGAGALSPEAAGAAFSGDTEKRGETTAEEGEEQTLSATQSGGAVSDSVRPETGPTAPVAKISGLSVMPIETNPDYRQMSFSFSCEGKEYECFVTGLKETGDCPADGYARLAREITGCFLLGETFKLSTETAEESFGLHLDLIDAEKISLTAKGDKEICWAASAADMLEFAGWNIGEDEDEAMKLFRESFSDNGGYQSAGISWYLDGVNTEQFISTSGKIVYVEMDVGAAQQLEPGTGGYWKEYAAAELAPEPGAYEDVSRQLTEGMEKLKEGYGVGTGVYYYRDGMLQRGGHALTVFGFINEVIERLSSLRAMFIADSDNDVQGRTDAPEDRPDTYTMYPVSPYEPASSVQLEGYSPSRETVIGTVFTLAPLEQAKESRETEGTGDGTKNVNLIPAALRLQDEDGVSIREIGEKSEVMLETDFQNVSYAALPEGACVRYEIDVFREGALVKTLTRTVMPDELRPMRGFSDRASVLLEESGEYSFRCRITAILDANGTALPEAYTRDNEYKGPERTLTVRAAAEEEALPEQTAVSDGEIHEAERAASKIYRLTVVLASDTCYMLEFEADAASPEDFRELRNRDTGELVDSAYYTVSQTDSGFVICFKEEFILRLQPGKNAFVLKYPGGRVLIDIMIV